jgi:hypothetical protein
MEKVAGAGASAGMGRELASGCLAALACLMCGASYAQDAGQGSQDVLVAQARIDPGVRVQVQTSALPRLDPLDNGFQAPRVDLTLHTSEGSGLAPVFGLSTIGSNSGLVGLQQRTGVDVGLRWTQRLQSQRQIDITAWRRMNAPDDAYSQVLMHSPVYGARIELNLTPVRKAGFLIDHGAIGFQMESGDKITIKRKDGRPMIYYRSTF